MATGYQSSQSGKPTGHFEAAQTKSRALVEGYRVRARRKPARGRGSQGVGEAPDVFGQSQGSGSGGMSSLIGGQQSRAAARALAEFRNWTYVCVNAIAKRCAAQSPVVATLKGAGAKQPERSLLPETKGCAFYSRVRRKLYQEEELEVQPNHEAMSWAERPNRVQRRWDFVYMTVANLLLTGEAYWVGGHAKDEETGEERVELWAIPSSWIEPDHSEGLFAAYKLKVSGSTGEAMPLDAANVVRLFFPDPADPKGCVSPAATQAHAVKIDESIQQSQQQAFANGVFPNVLVSVGQTIGADGKPTGARPVLTGAQRRNIVAAVRKIWQGVDRAGDPAILDGLIENVSKLSLTPAEMDWMQSGEQIKQRIFQAFGVHEFMVGAAAPGSYAQAAIVEGVFCHDSETECLTSAGWLKYHEITESTRIASYDHQTGLIHYRKPRAIHQLWHDGPMLRIESEQLDIAVTPDHRMLVQSHEKPGRRKRPWRVRTANDLAKTTPYRILSSGMAACSAPSAPFFIDQARKKPTKEIDPVAWADFLGWWITEGCISWGTKTKNKYVVSITQKKPENIPAIQAVIDRLPFRFRRHVNPRSGCTVWVVRNKGLYEYLERNCGKGSRNKKIPSVIKSWPAENLDRLLKIMVAGDGHVFHDGLMYYTTRSRRLADDVQEIAVKSGWRSVLRVKEHRGEPLYRVSICDKKTATTTGSSRRWVQYKGPVWCVTVDEGFFLVRRNGKVHVSGNCVNVVNPILDNISWAYTDFYMRATESPPNTLFLWLEPCEPTDPELRWRKFMEARQTDDVTRNEIRAELGLPPVEKEEQKSRLLESVGGMTGYVALLTAVGQGMIDRDAVVQALMQFFSIDETAAEAMVGATEYIPPEPTLLPGLPPADEGSAAGDGAAEGEIEDPDEPEEEEDPLSERNLRRMLRRMSRGKKAFIAGGPRLNRASLESSHLAKTTNAEREVASKSARFF